MAMATWYRMAAAYSGGAARQPTAGFCRLTHMKRILVVAAFAILATNVLFGQSNTDKVEFGAVSIKPSLPGARGGGYNVSTGRLNAKNQSLRDLVKFAFGVQDYQVTGGPAWIDSERYELLATFPGETTNAERGRMMQAALTDRFALVVHRESKEVAGYTLVVARSGSKLQVVTPGQSSMMLGRSATGLRTLTATSAGMAGFATLLASLLGRPVEDQTGLTGVFDLAMEWSPDDTQMPLKSPAKEAVPESADSPIGLSLFTAL